MEAPVLAAEPWTPPQRQLAEWLERMAAVLAATPP
jgi:hypothetical protein